MDMSQFILLFSLDFLISIIFILSFHSKKSDESNLNEDLYALKSDKVYNFLRIFFEKHDRVGEFIVCFVLMMIFYCYG